MKDFFSEEELREAAKKVRDAKLSTIPETVDVPIISPEFKKNISYLYKKEKRVRFISMAKKCVAAAVLIIVLGTTALLTMSSEARAAVTSWIKNLSKMYTFFSFEGEKGLEIPVYEPSWIPENYKYSKTEEIMADISIDEDGKPAEKVLNRRLTYVYIDDSTKELTLRYGVMKEGNSIKVQMDDAEYETEQMNINGAYSEIYISQDEQVSSAMIWFDEENQVYFLLIGHLSPEEMVRIAESVSVVE